MKAVESGPLYKLASWYGITCGLLKQVEGKLVGIICACNIQHLHTCTQA